jgi:hypothetical protein
MTRGLELSLWKFSEQLLRAAKIPAALVPIQFGSALLHRRWDLSVPLI